MKKHQWAYKQYGWEDLTPANKFLFESIELDTMPLLRNIRIITEAELSNDQIEQLFKNAENLSKEKGLKTNFGKSVSLPKDALVKVNGVLNKFGTSLQNSTPVKGFDQKFEQLKGNIKSKLGQTEKGQQILNFVDQLGNSAKAHPVWQSAIIGIIVAASSLLLGPASVPIVGFLLKGGAELLKGEKLSTALGKGIKTAAFGYLAGHIVGSIVGWAQGLNVTGNTVAPDVVHVSINASQNIHGVASEFHLPDVMTDAKDYQHLKQLVTDFGDPTKIGTAYQELLKFSQHLQSADYIDQLNEAAGKAVANEIEQQAFVDSVQHIGTVVRAAAEGLGSAAGEVNGRKSTAETQRLPQAVMEGLWSDLTLQFGAGKLMKIWNQAGRPTDSVDVAEMMANLGMSDEDIRDLMTKAGLSPEDVDATMKGLASGESDDNIEVPFVSGIESLDSEAKEIFKRKGEKAFDDFWKEKLPELEKKIEPETSDNSVSQSAPDDENTFIIKMSKALDAGDFDSAKEIIKTQGQISQRAKNSIKFDINNSKELDDKQKKSLVTLISTAPKVTEMKESTFNKIDKMLKEYHISWAHLGYRRAIRENKTKRIILI
jgi:hypothetical protein